jgi:hypothetical protein
MSPVQETGKSSFHEENRKAQRVNITLGLFSALLHPPSSI